MYGELMTPWAGIKIAAFFAGLELLAQPACQPPERLRRHGPRLDRRLRPRRHEAQELVRLPDRAHTRVAAGKVRVEVLGARKLYDEVAFERRGRRSCPSTRSSATTPTLASGAETVSQRGMRGFKVVRTRKLFQAGQVAKTESWDLFYPPTTEILRRGTNPRGERPEAKNCSPCATRPASCGSSSSRRAAVSSDSSPGPRPRSLSLQTAAPLSLQTAARARLSGQSRRRALPTRPPPPRTVAPAPRSLSRPAVARVRSPVSSDSPPAMRLTKTPLLRRRQRPLAPSGADPSTTPSTPYRPTSGRGSSRACSSSAGSCGRPAPSRTATRVLRTSGSRRVRRHLEGTR